MARKSAVKKVAAAVAPVEEQGVEEQVVEGQKRKKPLKPSQCRGYMRRKLAEKFEVIVAGFVKEAASGSCAHLKLTNDLLDEPAVKGPRHKGPAQRLLEELTGKRPGPARAKDGTFAKR